MTDILVPTPGESISEVEIGSWLVENGSWVEMNQEIASLESEKATLEVTTPSSGFIEIIANEGDAVKVGSVIARIKPGEKPDGAPEPVVKKVATEKAKTQAKPLTTTDTKQRLAENQSDIKITPVAKKMMELNNLDLDAILSGLKRIGKNEVDAVLSAGPLLTHNADTRKITERTESRSRMSLLRRKLSERLVAVKNSTAMLTTFNEVDMQEVMALRNQYKVPFQNKYGTKLGFMSFFTMATANALKSFPNINSMIDGDEIIQFSYQDIGIAVQTPKGLMVPIIKDAGNMNLPAIELAIAEMATKARDNKISLDELQGGTFSITNGGVFGSLLSTPILNPPQSAILGMHNIIERPIAINGQVVIRPMMYVAMSYDHRIVDGKDSVGFLKTIKELIENPYKLLDPQGRPVETLLGL